MIVKDFFFSIKLTNGSLSIKCQTFVLYFRIASERSSSQFPFQCQKNV